MTQDDICGACCTAEWCLHAARCLADCLPTDEDAPLRAVFDGPEPVAALSSAPPDLVRDVAVFVGRCRDIRHGSPNAFYAHVDKFCKAWPTCPDCGGMGTTTHDILVGGTEHDTEERDCQTCATTGIAPPVSPVVAPAVCVCPDAYGEQDPATVICRESGKCVKFAPVVAPAPVVEHEDPAIAAKTRAVMVEIAANHFTTVNQCPGLLAFGPIYRALAALSSRETAPGGGR